MIYPHWRRSTPKKNLIKLEFMGECPYSIDDLGQEVKSPVVDGRGTVHEFMGEGYITSMDIEDITRNCVRYVVSVEHFRGDLRGEPMDAEYDRRATELETSLRERVPLLEWEVERAAYNRARWAEIPDMALTSFKVLYSVIINNQRLAGQYEVSSHLKEDAVFDWTEYIAHNVAKKIADSILDWKK